MSDDTNPVEPPTFEDLVALLRRAQPLVLESIERVGKVSRRAIRRRLAKDIAAALAPFDADGHLQTLRDEIGVAFIRDDAVHGGGAELSHSEASVIRFVVEWLHENGHLLSKRP